MDPQQARVKARYVRQQQDNLRVRRGSTLIATFLGMSVVGIYFYSMYTIRQETIIKEIDEEISR